MMYIILLNVNTEYRLLLILTPYLKKEDKDKFTKNQIIYCTEVHNTSININSGKLNKLHTVEYYHKNVTKRNLLLQSLYLLT